MSSTHCEYETTCGFVFDSGLYSQIKDVLMERCKNSTAAIEENVDVYKDPDNRNGRYRETTQLTIPFSVDDVPTERKWDHKTTVYVQEDQIPYFEEKRGRIIFVTCTYKVSNERLMTRDEWKNTVREDHTSGRYTRTSNKKRICFYSGAFETNIPFTRVSVGEKSTYSGTLEARSTCNSVCFMEIEHETRGQLDSFSIQCAMNRLNELLFQLIPYDLVRQSMIASNTCSVQRERVDCIFDTFKRNFQNYTRHSAELSDYSAVGGRTDSGNTVKLDFYLMPKWDGVRAVGLYYCEGNLLIKDAYGRLSSFNTRLPFDNDMVFQLEVVEPEQRHDSKQDGTAACRYYVITELMAVLIKSQNTMFQVYSRNTIVHDTCRNIGNIVDGVSIKTQFDSCSHVCNLYRLLPADSSLRVLSRLTKQEVETNCVGSGVIILTAVVHCPETNTEVLQLMNQFVSPEKSAEVKQQVISKFSKWLPLYMRRNPRFERDCEGLILAYTVNENFRPCRKVKGVIRTKRRKNTRVHFDHGYFKLKQVDTVDLELNLNDGVLRSADGTAYAAEGLPTTLRGWAERPVPVRNKRAIVECYFNGERLQFLRDRCDKSRPDSDSKIAATNKLMYTVCRLIQ